MYRPSLEIAGPTTFFVPAGIYRCGDYPNPWSSLFLDFDPAANQNQPRTPGATNTTSCGGPGSPGVTFCEPGLNGVAACPCSNPPSGPGRGCDNSSATGGASLSSTGTASLAADTVVLATADEKPTATSIFLQGTSSNTTGVPFGQGLRCVAGALKRLYVKSASAGSATAPAPGDPSISARSATLGDPITAGTTRFYMVYYRDPFVIGGCAATATFNATQGQSVLWNP